MEKRDFFIKKIGAEHRIDWRNYGHFDSFSIEDLETAIAESFLEKGEFVFVHFEGLYQTPENDNEKNIVITKYYYALFSISDKYMLLNISEKGAEMKEIEPCWIGTTCEGKCGLEENCLHSKMMSLTCSGRMFIKNRLS